MQQQEAHHPSWVPTLEIETAADEKTPTQPPPFGPSVATTTTTTAAAGSSSCPPTPDDQHYESAGSEWGSFLRPFSRRPSGVLLSRTPSFIVEGEGGGTTSDPASEVTSMSGMAAPSRRKSMWSAAQQLLRGGGGDVERGSIAVDSWGVNPSSWPPPQTAATSPFTVPSLSGKIGVLRMLSMVVIGCTLFLPRLLLCVLSLLLLASINGFRHVLLVVRGTSLPPSPPSALHAVVCRALTRVVLFSLGFWWLPVSDERRQYSYSSSSVLMSPVGSPTTVDGEVNTRGGLNQL